MREQSPKPSRIKMFVSSGATRSWSPRKVFPLKIRRVTVAGTVEVGPKVAASRELWWDRRPTLLIERLIADPGGSGCEVLVLRVDTRQATFTAAAKRVPSFRTRVRRLVVDLQFIRARTYDASKILTDDAVEQQDPVAWLTLRSIYAWNVDCVIVSTKSHGDAIVVFREALGRSVIERDSAIYAINRRGKGLRNPPAPLRTLYDLALIPLGAAIIAIPIWELILHNADLTLPVPAFLVPLAVGLVAFGLTQRKHH